MRTIINIPPEQITALDKFRKALGVSRAEVIRRALAQLLERGQYDTRDKAFGAWKAKKINSAGFVKKIRNEWGK